MQSEWLPDCDEQSPFAFANSQKGGSANRADGQSNIDAPIHMKFGICRKARSDEGATEVKNRGTPRAAQVAAFTSGRPHQATCDYLWRNARRSIFLPKLSDRPLIDFDPVRTCRCGGVVRFRRWRFGEVKKFLFPVKHPRLTQTFGQPIGFARNRSFLRERHFHKSGILCAAWRSELRHVGRVRADSTAP